MELPPFRRFSAILAATALPATAFAARELTVNIGTSYDFQTIAENVTFFLATTITTVASAMFLVGAFMIVLSGAKEDYKQRGKDLMVGAAMSVGVVLGAYAIYRTVASFLA